MTVRPATPDDLSGVLGVLDAGALETDAGRIRESIDRGNAFVAVREGSGGDADATVLGAVVLASAADGESVTEIDAIAVRRRRRGQGIGRALVAAGAERYDRLIAEFDPKVRPFYEALGFSIRPIDDSERLVGRR
ncbi:GNAT family N-acetyltransferase [Halosimplex sp. J119]